MENLLMVKLIKGSQTKNARSLLHQSILNYCMTSKGNIKLLEMAITTMTFNENIWDREIVKMKKALIKKLNFISLIFQSIRLIRIIYYTIYMCGCEESTLHKYIFICT